MGSTSETQRQGSIDVRELGPAWARLDCRASCYPISYPSFNEEALGQRAWVIRLTHGRKARGTRACRRSGGRQRFPKRPKYLRGKDLNVHYFANKSLAWYTPNMRP